jgi:hypothetical protein
MPSFANPRGRVPPESLLKQVTAVLRNHALWDSLLIIGPPVLALIYGLVFLRRTAWIGDLTFVLTVSSITGLGLFAVFLRVQPRIPSAVTAARLADEKSGAKDHFLTLSTIDPMTCQQSFLERLRREAAIFSERIELKRDFPYQPKRSSYGSVVAALVVVTFIYFVAPLAEPMLRAAPVHERIREIAEKMAERPKLKGIAEALNALAAKIEDPNAPQEEKQKLVQEIEKQIAEQQKQEQGKKDRELLDQAANQLGGAEQQQSAGGKDQQKDQQNGAGGGIQSNLPQDNQGESKQSQGGSGESKGERTAELSQDMQQGKSAQGNPKEPGQDKNQPNQSETKNSQPDPSQPGKDQNKQKADKNQGGSKDGAGRNQASEEPPQNVAPAERLYKNGEGKEGLKGARYVTVQLPEDVAADVKGESMTGKESKGNRVGAKVPVSNVPLPAHVPNAAMEKQQLPIEYRGIIR